MSAKRAATRTKPSRGGKVKASHKREVSRARAGGGKSELEGSSKPVPPRVGKPKGRKRTAPAPTGRSAASPVKDTKKTKPGLVDRKKAPSAASKTRAKEPRPPAPAREAAPSRPRAGGRAGRSGGASGRLAKASEAAPTRASPKNTIADTSTNQAQEEKMKTTEEPTRSSAAVAKGRSVLRIAAGERRPKGLGKGDRADDASHPSKGAAGRTPSGPVTTIRRAPSPKIEINPRLESLRGRVPQPEPREQKERPMSVAQKNRAAAEAAFLRVAPASEAKTPAEVIARAATSNGTTHGPTQGPGQPHMSQFEMRISERDSLTTTLRLAESREAALTAARELARRFKLPPDQAILMKVIGLGEPGLTKLALEELLELDDRGRVRRTLELKDTLDRLRSDDRETVELKDLLLEKIGAFGISG